MARTGLEVRVGVHGSSAVKATGEDVVDLTIGGDLFLVHGRRQLSGLEVLLEEIGNAFSSQIGHHGFGVLEETAFVSVETRLGWFAVLVLARLNVMRAVIF